MRIETCRQCGEKFEAKSSASKVCSDVCREKRHIDARKKWRNKSDYNKKVWISYTSKYRDANPLRARLSSLKSRCNRLGILFEITEDDFIIPTICPVLGIPLDNRDRDHQWSVDKVIPSKGYTKENTRIISMRANRLKNDTSLEELRKIIRYIEESS